MMTKKLSKVLFCYLLLGCGSGSGGGQQDGCPDDGGVDVMVASETSDGATGGHSTADASCPADGSVSEEAPGKASDGAVGSVALDGGVVVPDTGTKPVVVVARTLAEAPACTKKSDCAGVGGGWCVLGRCCNGCLNSSKCSGVAAAECSSCIPLDTSCPTLTVYANPLDQWKLDPPASCTIASLPAIPPICVRSGPTACLDWHCRLDDKLCFSYGDYRKYGPGDDGGCVVSGEFGRCAYGTCQVIK